MAYTLFDHYADEQARNRYNQQTRMGNERRIGYDLGGGLGRSYITGEDASDLREQGVGLAARLDLLGTLGDQARQQAERRRALDMEEGLGFFNQQMKLTPDAFTRFGTKASGLQQDILARRQALLDPSQDIGLALDRAREGLQGFDSPALQAMREQQLQGVQRAGQTAQRDLRGSLGGLTGAARAAAEAQLQRDQSNRAANIEQQLLIEQANRQRQGLQDFATLASAEDQRRRASLGELEQSTFAQRQEALERQKLNRELAQQEMAARVGAQTGFAQMGASEIENLRNLLSSSEMAQAVEESGGGGKKSHFCLEFHKRGLISTRELYKLTNAVIKGMFSHGDFVYWYMKHADKIASSANQAGFDWGSVVKIVPTCIELFDTGNVEMGNKAYMIFCRKMAGQFGGDVPEFDPRFFEKRKWARFVGTLKILAMPKTWTHLPKVLRSRVKHYRKGGLWNQAA